jgi:DNA helicase II / ATP-dependent DNA helicase PcrA
MSRLTEAISLLRENPRQKEAFETTGHCAVLAPPGSGKTMLLTTRVAYDLASRRIPPPQGAGCITMTNEAASELRRRLSRLGIERQPNLFIGTVHAFALAAIVAPFARIAGLPEVGESRLASEQEKDDAFDQAFIEILGAGEDPRFIRTTMEKTRRLADYSGSIDVGGPEIAALARRYEEILLDNRTFDFNDLMKFAVELVNGNEWLRRILISVYPNLYVDEYQDLPPTLDTLVKSLAFDQAVDATLFAVGDPDQAINGFMGTKPELLNDLAETTGVTRVELNVNYRCGQAIVDASLLALGETRSVRGASDGGEIVIEAVANGENGQRQLAVELVQQALDEDTPHEEITVLAQAGPELKSIVEMLREAGVPVFARLDNEYGTTPVTLAIESLALYAAADPPPLEQLSELLNEWKAVTPDLLDHEDVAQLVAVLSLQRTDSPAAGFVEALIELGLQPLVDDPGSSYDGRELERMRTALQSGGTLEGLAVNELGERARAQGRVMAATIHGIKGLQFDVVVLCDCEEGRIPHWQSIKPPNAARIAEDKRKFYVSLTRARRRVHLVSASWRISKKGNQYPITRSRFMEPLE